MARSEEGMLFWQSLVDFWKSRLRRKDLLIAVPLGVAYGLAHAVLLQLVRQWLGIPDLSGDVGRSYFADPSDFGLAATGGILLVWFFAFAQVNEGGIPDGLTPQAALKPVAFMAVMTLISVPRLVENHGYGYAAAVFLVICLNTLCVSFLLRWCRRKL